MDIRQEIICEIDSRLDKLKAHQKDRILPNDNQYIELNQALSKVIGAPLIQELENLKDYIVKL